MTLIPPDPIFLNAIVGGRCALKCPFCVSWRDEVPEMPAARWAAAFRELGAWLPGAATTLSGGEPLLHPEIAAIIEAAGAAGLRASVSTSGDPFTPELARAIAGSGVHGVNVSLDDFAPGHDRWRGREGLFAHGLGFVDYLKELRPAIVVTISVVIHRDNLPRLREFTELLLAKPEVDQIYFQAVVNQRGLCDPAADPASLPWFPGGPAAAAFLDWLTQQRAATIKIRNSPRQIDAWRDYFATPREMRARLGACRVGDYALTILPNGDVRLCDFFAPLGNVAGAGVRELWLGELATSQRAAMRECPRVCNYVINCAFEDLHRPLFEPAGDE